jgi:hypothetical protein
VRIGFLNSDDGAELPMLELPLGEFRFLRAAAQLSAKQPPMMMRPSKYHPHQRKPGTRRWEVLRRTLFLLSASSALSDVALNY